MDPGCSQPFSVMVSRSLTYDRLSWSMNTKSTVPPGDSPMAVSSWPIVCPPSVNVPTTQVSRRRLAGDPQCAVAAIGAELQHDLRIRALHRRVEQPALDVADVDQQRLVI